MVERFYLEYEIPGLFPLLLLRIEDKDYPIRALYPQEQVPPCYFINGTLNLQLYIIRVITFKINSENKKLNTNTQN